MVLEWKPLKVTLCGFEPTHVHLTVEPLRIVTALPLKTLSAPLTWAVAAKAGTAMAAAVAPAAASEMRSLCIGGETLVMDGSFPNPGPAKELRVRRPTCAPSCPHRPPAPGSGGAVRPPSR